MASFVIIFHPMRIDNLKQTLRFLCKRESSYCLRDLVLVCQTKCDTIAPSCFESTKQINMNLDFYWKSKMTNVGVEEAKEDIVVLLDSDRILPLNYFEKKIKKIKKNQVVSTNNLIKLKKDYSDDLIEKKQFEFLIDLKDKSNKGRNKNLFAGNTIMFKKDFFELGGYDEDYKGYGYADTDMTEKIIRSNLEVLWSNEEEIHLNHSKVVSWNSDFLSLDSFKIQTAINGFKYYKKWKIKFEPSFLDLINDIDNSNVEFPSDLFKEYCFYKNKKNHKYL